MTGVKNSPAVGRIRVWRAEGPPLPFDDPRWSLVCLLGDVRPRPVRGMGGWGATARTGRRGLATYGGKDTQAVEIQLMLDASGGTRTGEKVENLKRLAGWFGDDAPPLIRWAANCADDHDDRPRAKWVIESLDLGDTQSDNAGRILWWRATVVVGLFEDVGLDVKASKGFDRRELHPSQDLRDFAKRWLGDPKRWDDVAQLNRDNPRCPKGPHGHPKRTITLLVPVRESEGSRARDAGRKAGALAGRGG